MSELTRFLKIHKSGCYKSLWPNGKCNCGLVEAREYYFKMLKELKETKKGKAKLADFIDTMANEQR